MHPQSSIAPPCILCGQPVRPRPARERGGIRFPKRCDACQVPRSITRLCETCSKPVTAQPYLVRQGHGRFCSPQCYGATLAHPQSDPAERFWTKVDKSGDCWLWTARRTRKGYGRIWYAGRLQNAHRVAWLLTNGAIPDGLEVCHNCPGGDNPSCVRPAHLWLGTHAQNLADAKAKARTATGDRNGSRQHPERVSRGARHAAIMRQHALKGEQVHSAKLTTALVLDMRARHARTGEPAHILAPNYGISPRQARDILRRKAWTHC